MTRTTNMTVRRSRRAGRVEGRRRAGCRREEMEFLMRFTNVEIL